MTQEQMTPALKELRQTINTYISDPNWSAPDVANLAVGFLYYNGGKDESNQGRVRGLAAALIAFTRRQYSGRDGIHYIRMLINRPRSYYLSRFNASETAMLREEELDTNSIAILDCCLRQVDSNPHVVGPQSGIRALLGADSIWDSIERSEASNC